MYNYYTINWFTYFKSRLHPTIPVSSFACDIMRGETSFHFFLNSSQRPGWALILSKSCINYRSLKREKINTIMLEHGYIILTCSLSCKKGNCSNNVSMFMGASKMVYLRKGNVLSIRSDTIWSFRILLLYWTFRIWECLSSETESSPGEKSGRLGT